MADALAVHQNERGLAAEAAQVHGGCAGEIGDVVQVAAEALDSRVGILRQLSQHALERRFAGRADEVSVKNDEVARQFLRRARDPRACDDDFLDFRGRDHGRIFELARRYDWGLLELRGRNALLGVLPTLLGNRSQRCAGKDSQHAKTVQRIHALVVTGRSHCYNP